MNKYQFKTNINCSGCVAKVTPALDSLKGVIRWDVDIDNPSKILTVEAEEELAPDVVSGVVKGVGFNSEKI